MSDGTLDKIVRLSGPAEAWAREAAPRSEGTQQVHRCPIHNAPLQCPRCSLKSQLHAKYLTSNQLLFLITAIEHCSDGNTIWASVRRLRIYSKLSRATVQAFLRYMSGRHWLTQLAPANEARALPATYRLNIHAIPDDPRMIEFLAQDEQQGLPGIDRRPIPGERIPDRLCPATEQVMGSNFLGNPAQPLGYPAQPLGYPAQPLGPTLRKNNDNDDVTFPVAYRNDAAVVVDPVRNSEAITPAPCPVARQGMKTSAQVDRATIIQAILMYASHPDQKAIDLIIDGCLRKQPGASTDEIVASVHSRGAQVLSGRITNPIGFLITSVPECFCGEAFGEWRNLRAAAAVEVAAVEAQNRSKLEVRLTCPQCGGDVALDSGKCLSCGHRLSFAELRQD